eukprot:ANDGO_02746.mRNA.1 hypothetical protein
MSESHHCHSGSDGFSSPILTIASRRKDEPLRNGDSWSDVGENENPVFDAVVIWDGDAGSSGEEVTGDAGRLPKDDLVNNGVVEVDNPDSTDDDEAVERIGTTLLTSVDPFTGTCTLQNSGNSAT